MKLFIENKVLEVTPYTEGIIEIKVSDLVSVLYDGKFEIVMKGSRIRVSDLEIINKILSLDSLVLLNLYENIQLVNKC